MSCFKKIQPMVSRTPSRNIMIGKYGGEKLLISWHREAEHGSSTKEEGVRDSHRPQGSNATTPVDRTKSVLYQRPGQIQKLIKFRLYPHHQKFCSVSFSDAKPNLEIIGADLGLSNALPEFEAQVNRIPFSSPRRRH